jgi:hypothetical protein
MGGTWHRLLISSEFGGGDKSMAEGYWETVAFTGDGPAVCAGDGIEGEISNLDVHAGEFYGVPGAFLLPDGQPLSSSTGGSADGRGQS